MSKETVYERLAIPESQHDTIKGFTYQSQRQIYAATVRSWLARFGINVTTLTIDDPDVLDALDTWSDDQAERIIRVFNEYLQRELDALPPLASDAELIAALENDFLPRTRAYNRRTMIPHTSRWTRQQATNDFFTKNGLLDELQWSCEPPIVTNQSCQVCIGAIDSSPMSSDEAAGYDMPNHQNCPHGMTPSFPPGTTLPDTPWTGQLHTDQEAA